MSSPYEDVARSIHRSLRTLAVRTGPKISSCAICGARWRTREWHKRENCAAHPDYIKAITARLLAKDRVRKRRSRKKLLPVPAIAPIVQPVAKVARQKGKQMNTPNYANDTTARTPDLNKTKGNKTMAKKKAAKKAAAPMTAEARSKLVAKTWKDPDVAASRATHHAVKVGGETFRSVLAAFQALNLPIGRHIPFRKALKAQGVGGSLAFETDDGKKTKFTLVELPKVDRKPAVKKASKKVAKKKVAAKRAAKSNGSAAEQPAEQAPATA